MDKTPAELLAAALAQLEVISDNFRYHVEGCGVCAGQFRCQTAAYWNGRSIEALDDVEHYQREARRAAILAAR